MLTATFVHVQGIGDVTEKRLWDAGVLSWEDALRAGPSDLPLTAAQRALLRPTIEASVEALACRDFRYFAGVLPRPISWTASGVSISRPTVASGPMTSR